MVLLVEHFRLCWSDRECHTVHMTAPPLSLMFIEEAKRKTSALSLIPLWFVSNAGLSQAVGGHFI